MKCGKIKDAEKVCDKVELEANKLVENVNEWPDFLTKPEQTTVWEALQGKSPNPNVNTVDLRLPPVFRRYQKSISKSIVDGIFVEKLKTIRDPRDSNKVDKGEWVIDPWKNDYKSTSPKVFLDLIFFIYHGFFNLY